MSNLPIKTR